MEIKTKKAKYESGIEVEVLESFKFETTCHPTLDFEQLDLCNDMEETIDVWLKVNVEITKAEFFELLKLKTNCGELWKEDDFPVTIEIKSKQSSESKERKDG